MTVNRFSAFVPRGRCRITDAAAMLAAGWLLLAGTLWGQENTATSWQAGFSKVDVTPTEPVRMAGYGSRDRPSEGVDMPLLVRCLALQPRSDASEQEEARTLVLLSVDSIGLPGSMTRELAETLEQQHGLRREEVVFCNTHTHTGPDLVSELSNIFTNPMSDEEIAAGRRYRGQLGEGILESVDRALADLEPAELAYQVGEASFAANRRVLTDGIWSGFGVQPDGPVDHTVPVLRIMGEGGKLRGVVFNYACHCTTLGGDYYRINGDWAGYAAIELESEFPDAVALCTIGCGADANPEPRGKREMAEAHGKALAAEIKRVIDSEMRSIDAAADPRFDYAALSFELPTPEELQQRLEDRSPQTRRHAEQLLKTYQQEGRLPATYPVPIQAWKFGDQLTMTFLGGEVVVDYALRLKKTLDDPDLWVTAYANDVLGYIASERMRTEKGYEYDRSGVFYGLPGPWASGTEDRLIGRVEDLVHGGGRSKPQSPDDALGSFQLTDGYEIELVAAEPLVTDPINLAFGEDGRLWVVEMGDYPEGEEGGRVRVLSDSNGDGTFDTAMTFLDGLSYPTGVQPWGDGVLISAAPDILFARDTDGDGRADVVTSLYRGFRLANPQHRINGFSYGLDHSLHLASGDTLEEITSTKTGEQVNASGHDVQIWPDDGSIAVTSGRTQFIRSRDDWGRWFGNNNSRPMYQFPIDDAYLRRNHAVSYSGNTQSLFDPPVAPRVYPVTEALERFNDLFAANRFTSACSSIVARSPHFDQDSRASVFICEPVHNLVHRSLLIPDGSTFRAERTPDEEQAEFLASRDPWFRPARAAIGPDGMLWVADMYREVIEHPEWIPEAWQQQLDLRAGEDRGRIYRVRPRGAESQPLVSLADRSGAELVDALRSPVGPLRDMAQRLILQRADPAAAEPLLELLSDSSGTAAAQAHALSILEVQGQLESEVLQRVLEEDHPGLLTVAIRTSEPRLDEDPELLGKLASLAAHPEPSVALQTALALGQSSSPAAGEALARIAARPDLDRWLAMAVTSSASDHAAAVAEALLAKAGNRQGALSDVALQLLADSLVTAQDSGEGISERVVEQLVNTLTKEELSIENRLRIAAGIAPTFQNAKALASVSERLFGPLRETAWKLAHDSTAAESSRSQALTLIGTGPALSDAEREALWSLLSPRTPPKIQRDAIDCLTRRSEPDVVDALAARWESLTKSVRDHGVQRVLSRQPLTERLLQLLESGDLRVRDLAPAARQQLLQGGSRSMKVRAARLVDSRGSAEKENIVRRYLESFGASADEAASVNGGTNVKLGKQLYEKHCATCHVAGDSNQAIGPSLENMTSRSDRYLVEAVLDPNRAVEAEYQSYLIHTDDKRILAGVIESEVGNSLTLAQADGKRVTIRRDRIEAMKSTGMSLMPEGFEENLAPHELEAIVRYVQQFTESSGR